jgi:hypothetical protein
MIKAQGASALAAVLTETKITTLWCAATPERSFSCQRPLTFTFTSSTSSLLHVPTCDSKRAHLLPCSLSEPSSLLPAPLPHSHPRDAALNRAPRGLRPLFPAVRVDHACSRIPTPHPLVTSPSHSVRCNYLDDQAKQAIKDAAGSDVLVAL